MEIFFTQVNFFYHLSSLYPLPCVRALAGAHHDNRFCVMERRICFVHLEVINQWVMGFVLVDKIGKNDFVNDFFHVFVVFFYQALTAGSATATVRIAPLHCLQHQH